MSKLKSLWLRRLLLILFDLQGEELIRVRRELEKGSAAFELIRATDQHVSGMQNAFRGRHTQISSLEAVIVNLQRENDSSLGVIRKHSRKHAKVLWIEFHRFVDNHSDLKDSNKLDSIAGTSPNIDDELTKAQAHDSPHSTNALVSPEEPVSQFSRYNDSEVEILRQDLVDAVSHANNLQYHLDAALEANEALEEKVMELSSQAQAAHSDNVKEEHTNNSYDAGEKHDSALLADEPSTSLKDVVVGQPDSIPAAVPVPQATHGTSADVVDSPKVRATTRNLCPGV
ncbi:hypothetical protein BT96DRAFT_927063 [Gymnopus androsaceus JB14]|uniref:Uncharacterized protein n=1 Tax=Gymnopus androsaceus JB14 TaxID=1447944 RepID=A0A6A4GT57_9AGAR|nr:hypothetical protein BT96DRAFT_927063 [Gymnopus androsaceus JB14]